MRDDDEKLTSEVAALLGRCASWRRHHIAAGVRLEDGDIITAINVVSNYGARSLCAEQVAISVWASSSKSPIVAAVAMRATFTRRRPAECVPPCGACREICFEYAPQSYFLVPNPKNHEGIVKIDVRDLIPIPFERRTNSKDRD